jgi:hypothetical protein
MQIEVSKQINQLIASLNENLKKKHNFVLLLEAPNTNETIYN